MNISTYTPSQDAGVFRPRDPAFTPRLSIVGLVADWHAVMALKAYRKRDWPTYTRHIRIADKIRSNP